MSIAFRLRLYRRVQDALREIGTLLIAFAPLDVGLQGVAGRVHVLVFFLSVGAGFFGCALVLEWRLESNEHQ